MSTQRVAIIFDNVCRPDTTGVYCERALRQLVAVEHYLPSQLHRVPGTGFDLYIQIDDGLEYAWPEDLHPAAFWAIDTHLGFLARLQKAQHFELVFAAQREGAARLRDCGIATASWLPLACDPEVHRKHDVAKSTDFAFVGNLAPGPRADLLALLKRHYPSGFIGQCFFEDMARTYSAARLIFNRSVLTDVNMRVFEALACGSLLVTNDLRDNGQEELFRDGVHLATYRDAEELLDKVRFYLSRETLREQIAGAGRAEALAKHTYRLRMERILEAAQALLGRPRNSQPQGSSLATDAMASLAPGQRDHGRTSLIILTRNQLEYTKLCVQSVQERTPEPHELIFVDNGSSDGTVAYLRSIPGAKVIENRDNLGFPKAANQGIQAATGTQILLLNNDTVVTTGWLEELLTALDRDPRIGLAGPVSNCVSGEQQIPASYRDLSELETFARGRHRAHRGSLVDTDRLVGFCLLIRRQLIDRIGLLDERFNQGCFEDDDYTRRALEAGYRAVIAPGAFVHHFGGVTFRGEKVDFSALMRQNEALFRAKWDAEPRSRPPLPAPSQQGAGPENRRYMLTRAKTGGLVVTSKRILISLCMIVRDNARTFDACLASIRPFVDEIIVVDTGSKDDTPQIAARYGARVFHFVWCDDFSAARNESLKHARGEWIFWMDSDDTVDPHNGQALRELARSPSDPSILGYIVKVHCPSPGADGSTEVTIVDHVKLFRNRPDLRFTQRIHEQILPAIREAGGEVVMTGLFVTHSGYDHSPEGQAHKLGRDLRILHKELEEQPEHPFTLFNLGMTYVDAGRWTEAAGFLRRSIAHSLPTSTHLRKAYALLLVSYNRQGELARARETCAEGLKLFPLDLELRFRRAALLHEQGELVEAIAAYRDVLERPDDVHFSSVQRGFSGHLARHNLAVAYAAIGNVPAAIDEWHRITQEEPRYRPGWRGLGECLLQAGRWQEAEQLAHTLLDDEFLRPDGLLIRGKLLATTGRVEEAHSSLAEAARSCPDNPDLQRSLCEFLFHHADPASEEPALRELLRRDPEDAAAHHNLGTALFRMKRYAEAVPVYRASLDKRPGHVPTLLQLAYAQKENGDSANALATIQRACELAPNDPVIQQARAEIEEIARSAHRAGKGRSGRCRSVKSPKKHPR